MMTTQDNSKPMYMYINSPGGSVTAGFAMFDTMRYVKADVSTINVGLAASMGSLLLAGGSKGKRLVLPHSRVMIHQPSMGGIRGQASDIKVEAEMILGIRERVVRRAHLPRSSADRRALLAPSNAGRHKHALVRIPSPQRYKPEPLTPVALDARACLLPDQLLRAAERPVAREGGPGPRPRQLPQRAGGHGLRPGRSHRGVVKPLRAPLRKWGAASRMVRDAPIAEC